VRDAEASRLASRRIGRVLWIASLVLFALVVALAMLVALGL
jgi:hypothetical protein